MTEQIQHPPLPQIAPAPPAKCWQRDSVSSFSYYLHGSAASSSSQSSLPPSVSSSRVALSLLHQCVVLRDALSSQLFQDVVEVSGVGEAVARQVGAELRLMMDLKVKGSEGGTCQSLHHELTTNPIHS